MMVGHTYRHCEDRARILDSVFLILGVSRLFYHFVTTFIFGGLWENMI